MREWDIIIFIPLNTQNFPERQEESWYKKRMDIFKEYTLKSLIKQSTQNFHVWLLCEPKLKHYSETWKTILPNDRYQLVYNIKKLWKERDKTQPTMIFRLDTDDMYHPNAFEKVIERTNTTNKNYIQFTKGYVMDIYSYDMFEWIHHSPPFYARLWRKGWNIPDAKLREHDKIAGKSKKIKDQAMFIVGYHHKNKLNKIDSPGKGHTGREVVGREKMKILKDFNL